MSSLSSFGIVLNQLPHLIGAWIICGKGIISGLLMSLSFPSTV